MERQYTIAIFDDVMKDMYSHVMKDIYSHVMKDISMS